MKFIKYLLECFWEQIQEYVFIISTICAIFVFPLGLAVLLKWWIGADMTGITIVGLIIEFGVIGIIIKYNDYLEQKK